MSREEPAEHPDAHGDGDGNARRHDSGETPSLRERIADSRDRVRSTPRSRVASFVVASALGLGLAWAHWLGLVAGGALVGLVAPTLRRAPLYGLGFGVVVLAAFAATVSGSLPAVVAMTPIVYLAVAAGLGLPLLGSLVRGLE